MTKLSFKYENIMLIGDFWLKMSANMVDRQQKLKKTC